MNSLKYSVLRETQFLDFFLFKMKFGGLILFLLAWDYSFNFFLLHLGQSDYIFL